MYLLNNTNIDLVCLYFIILKYYYQIEIQDNFLHIFTNYIFYI